MTIKYLSSLMSLLLLVGIPLCYAFRLFKARKIKPSISYIAMGGVFYIYVMKAGTQLLLPAFRSFGFLQKILNDTAAANILIAATELLFMLLAYFLFYTFAIRKKEDEKAIFSFSLGVIVATVILSLFATTWGNFVYYRAEAKGILEEYLTGTSYTPEQIESLRLYYSEVTASQCCLPGIIGILITAFHYFMSCLLLHREEMPQAQNTLSIFLASIVFTFAYYLMPLINAPIALIVALGASFALYLYSEKINSTYQTRRK